MKRMLSSVIAAVATVSFVGIVSAAEPVQQTTPSAAGQTAIQQQAPQATKQHRKYYKTRKIPKRVTTTARPRTLPAAK
jgi:hypothetical protein